MALSEQERKLLEQLEASLMAEDPRLADRLSGTAEVRVHRRRAALAGLGLVVGIVVLVAGVSVHPAVSVVGFVIMLAAVLIGVNSWQHVGGDGQPSRPKPAPPKNDPPTSSGSDFMEKLEERWRRRQEGDS